MRNFDFCLIFETFALDDDDVAEALYSRIDDALFGFRSGVAYLDFAREAGSPEEAIISAIDDVQAVGLGLRVARVEADDPAGSEAAVGTKAIQDARAIAAVNAALELARWHKAPETALEYLRPKAIRTDPRAPIRDLG